MINVKLKLVKIVKKKKKMGQKIDLGYFQIKIGKNAK